MNKMRPFKLLYDEDKLEELRVTNPALYIKLQMAAQQQLAMLGKKERKRVKNTGIGSGSFKLLSAGI